MSITGLTDWLCSAQGEYICRWEKEKANYVVSDIFGYHALQIGLPEVDFLSESRIPNRQKVAQTVSEKTVIEVYTDFYQLPFRTDSIDLIVLPHVLEFYPDPHQILREIERILIPEGKLLITGFNPVSLWGLTRYYKRQKNSFPWNGHFFTVSRLKDWLKLLGMELDRGAFGCYAPPYHSEQWLSRFHFMESMGDRWWSFAGSVYFLRAIKRTQGMHLVGPTWKTSTKRATALSPATQRTIKPAKKCLKS